MIEKFEKEIFEGAGYAPTQAASIRFRTILALALCGMPNDMGKGRLNSAINQLMQEVRSSLQSRMARLSEIATSSEQCAQLLQYFPSEIGMKPTNMTDGRTFCDAFSNVLGHDMVKKIMRSSGGPFVSLGFAMSTVGESAFGSDDSEAKFSLLTAGPSLMSDRMPIVKRTL